MELLEGETLHQRLGRGAMDATVLVDTGLALADATAKAAPLDGRLAVGRASIKNNIILFRGLKQPAR